MSEIPTGDEVCVVCGKAIAEDSGASHVHHDGRSFALCCPMCLQMFERASDRFMRGERPKDLIDQLIDETKWKDSGRQ